MDIGRVCVKKAGRETGNLCMVVEEIDDNFVKIDGPDVKRRRCNISHLKKKGKKLKIKKSASEKKVLSALEEAGLIKGKGKKEKEKEEKKSKKKKSKKPKKKGKKKKEKKFEEKDLSDKSYRELQKLAKKHDIKATQKKETLVKELKKKKS